MFGSSSIRQSFRESLILCSATLLKCAVMESGFCKSLYLSLCVPYAVKTIQLLGYIGTESLLWEFSSAWELGFLVVSALSLFFPKLANAINNALKDH